MVRSKVMVESGKDFDLRELVNSTTKVSADICRQVKSMNELIFGIRCNFLEAPNC